MSLPWYYLERPARVALLRGYYTFCCLAYPTYVAINFKDYVPDRAEVLGARSLKENILNPQGIKK